MRICPRLLAVLSGVAANSRKPWIIAACALALSSLGLSAPAWAQCSGSLDNVICTKVRRRFLIILLVAPFALAAASGANAQPVLFSGSNATTTVTSPPFTEIQGTNTITVPSGNGVEVDVGGNLIIDSRTGTAGPITIRSTTATGVLAIDPSSTFIDAGSGAPVMITGSGSSSALSVLQGALATGNANDGTLTLRTSGSGFGVVVQSFAPATTPSILTLDGADVSCSGPSYNGGVLVGGGGSMNINGENVPGTRADLTNVTINEVSPGFAGLLANRGTLATMTGGSITITGDGNPATGSGPSPPNGIVAAAGVMTNTGGQAILSNVAITTNGSNSPAVDQETQLNVLGTTPPGGPITITGGSIKTLGANSFGVLANAVGGTVTLSGTPITTSGADAAGFFANAGTITATNTTTQTSGASAPGGILSNGGTLTINGGSVTTTGAGSFGFLFEPSLAPPLTPTPTAPNTLAINSATVNSAADAFNVDDAVADIAVTGSSITGKNGVLLNTLLSSATTLTATGSHLTGAITTDSTSTADVTLQGNTTWTMPGDSNLTNLTFDDGTLQFGGSFNLATTGSITLNAGGGTIDTNGNSTTIVQSMVGVGGLTKVGAGSSP
jgi:hypothetical protein